MWKRPRNSYRETDYLQETDYAGSCLKRFVSKAHQLKVLLKVLSVETHQLSSQTEFFISNN